MSNRAKALLIKNTFSEIMAMSRRHERYHAPKAFESLRLATYAPWRRIADGTDDDVMYFSTTGENIRQHSPIPTQDEVDAELDSCRFCSTKHSGLIPFDGVPIYWTNDFDETTPTSNGFKFVDRYVLREGVQRVDQAFMEGCECRKDNGRKIGCEFRSCSCIGKMPEEQRIFPYFINGLLRPPIIDSRLAIFECNDNCNCGDHCKNKLVQWGRTK